MAMVQLPLFGSSDSAQASKPVAPWEESIAVGNVKGRSRSVRRSLAPSVVACGSAGLGVTTESLDGREIAGGIEQVAHVRTAKIVGG